MALLRFTLVALALVLGVGAPASVSARKLRGSSTDDDSGFLSVQEFLSFSPHRFGTAAALLDKAGLLQLLGAEFTGTVFVPTNRAFRRVLISPEAVEAADAAPILLYHASNTKVTADMFLAPGGTVIETLRGGAPLTVHDEDEIKTSSQQFVEVLEGPILAGQAMVYVVKSVMIAA